jgi:hypothetical protein
VCKPDYLGSLSACYGATTALADQLLLDIFSTYERALGTSVMLQLLVWGPESSGIDDKLQLMMGSHATETSLSLVEPIFMLYTWTRYPVNRPLLVRVSDADVFEYFDRDCKLNSTKAAPIYDPAFFLPLFSAIMSQDPMLDCRRFIEVNALGLVLVSLSSNDQEVRKVAYHLMDEFWIRLEVMKVPICDNAMTMCQPFIFLCFLFGK